MERVKHKLNLSEEALEREKRRFSLQLLRPTKTTAATTFGSKRLVVRRTPDATAERHLADVAHVVTYHELLDDVLWEDVLLRTTGGEFAGADMHLPTQTFTLELRPRERPCGIKGLRGAEKEQVRSETVVSRRLATIAATLQDAGRPWLAWTESAATGAADPTDLPDWAALRGRRTLWSDAPTGLRLSLIHI